MKTEEQDDAMIVGGMMSARNSVSCIMYVLAVAIELLYRLRERIKIAKANENDMLLLHKQRE